MKIEAGKKYRTRGGALAVVACIDAPGAEPLIGYIMHGDGVVRAHSWEKDGRVNGPLEGYCNDLISEHREKKAGWVNVYYEEDDDLGCVQGPYEDKGEADQHANNTPHYARIACIRVEYEEGEGL